MESTNPDPGSDNKLDSYQQSEFITMINKKLETLNINQQAHFPIAIALLEMLLKEEKFESFDEIRKANPADFDFDLTSIESIYEDLEDPSIYGLSNDAFDEFRKLLKTRIAKKIEVLTTLSESERESYLVEQKTFLGQKKGDQAKVKAVTEQMTEKLLKQIDEAINSVIKEYLEVDNPKRPKFLQAITGLVGMGGDEGRERALNYKNLILAYKKSAKTAGELITQIILDVVNEDKNSPLAGSTKLRDKISNLIRPYVQEAVITNGINNWDVLTEANRLAEQRANANAQRQARYGGYLAQGPNYATSDDRIEAAMKMVFQKAKGLKIRP